MSKIKLSEDYIKDRVKLALTEDLFPNGDITTNLLNNNKIVTARLISNQKDIYKDKDKWPSLEIIEQALKKEIKSD